MSIGYTYKELTDRVSKYLGTYGSSGPSGSDLATAQDMVKSGYLRFLTAYDWTFRRRYATLSTLSGQHIYELPEDFGGIRTPFKYNDVSGYPPLEEITDGEIIELQGYGENISYPENYAIRAGLHDPETGQRYEVLFWPTPTAEYSLYYSFFSMPKMMSGDSDVPMGGAEHAECLLRFCMAAAELEEDEVAGPQTEDAGIQLQRSIQMDKLREPRTLGGSQKLSAFEVARGSYRLRDITGFSDA